MRGIRAHTLAAVAAIGAAFAFPACFGGSDDNSPAATAAA